MRIINTLLLSIFVGSLLFMSSCNQNEDLPAPLQIRRPFKKITEMSQSNRAGKEVFNYDDQNQLIGIQQLASDGTITFESTYEHQGNRTIRRDYHFENGRRVFRVKITVDKENGFIRKVTTDDEINTPLEQDFIYHNGHLTTVLYGNSKNRIALNATTNENGDVTELRGMLSNGKECVVTYTYGSQLNPYYNSGAYLGGNDYPFLLKDMNQNVVETTVQRTTGEEVRGYAFHYNKLAGELPTEMSRNTSVNGEFRDVLYQFTYDKN